MLMRFTSVAASDATCERKPAGLLGSRNATAAALVSASSNRLADGLTLSVTMLALGAGGPVPLSRGRGPPPFFSGGLPRRPPRRIHELIGPDLPASLHAGLRIHRARVMAEVDDRLEPAEAV